MNGEDFKVSSGQGAPPSGGFPQPPKFPTPPAIPPRPSVQPDFMSQDALVPSPIPEGVEEAGGSGGSRLKTGIIIVASLVLALAIGFLGYFVVFPLLFPVDDKSALSPGVASPVGQLLPHQSYLQRPPSAESAVILSDYSYLTIATALQNEAFSPLADNQLKEIKISEKKGQVAFSEYLGAVAPVTASLDLRSWLEDDFTALLYYNPAGVWPVYIAKLKSGVDPQTVTTGFQSVESAMETGNFYLTSPGTFSGFKDGKYKTYSTRYNVGSVLGYSFNYGIFDQYLVFATNFDGLKATLPLLGL